MILKGFYWNCWLTLVISFNRMARSYPFYSQPPGWLKLSSLSWPLHSFVSYPSVSHRLPLPYFVSYLSFSAQPCPAVTVIVVVVLRFCHAFCTFTTALPRLFLFSSFSSSFCHYHPVCCKNNQASASVTLSL